MAAILGKVIVLNGGTGSEIPNPALPYVLALIRGDPLDYVVQDLLEEEGLVEESWHREIGYLAGMLDDKFGESEWQDEFDCQRDSRLLEDEFIHGGRDDVD